MLHYDQLTAPIRHGGVLVAPPPLELARLVRTNASLLGEAAVNIGTRSLSEWRRATRQKLLPDVAKDAPVIMVGHQPGLIHAGVWAKNVVAHRLAAALSGVALHLSVDSDAPRDLMLRVPVEDGGRWVVRSISMGPLRTGVVYEQIPALRSTDLAHARQAVEELLGPQAQGTQLTRFFEGLGQTQRDWVSQIIAGRRAVERELGIALVDLRVRDVWWSPLAAHIMSDARCFAGHYNEAIAAYRQRFHVRSANRPVPPLQLDSKRVELPFWLFDANGPRHRAFLIHDGSNRVLQAGSQSILSLPRDELNSSNDLVENVERQSGWRLRPRALITTLWSRVFLADLFIHGIGGAKYDRITDILIERYFRLPVPHVACVTGTLYLDPRCEAPLTSGSLEHKLRDLTWNPERHFVGEASAAFQELAQSKSQAIARAASLARSAPRDRAARKTAYDEIRNLNEQLAVQVESAKTDLVRQIDRSREVQLDRRALCDREVFFALHSRQNLDRLLSALPAESDFVPA